MKTEKKNKTLPLKKAIEEAEKKIIISALKASGNNRSEAARMLGISRRALYNKIDNYSINSSAMTHQRKKTGSHK